MLVEGVGKKAPAPVGIRLSPGVLDRLESAAAERNRFRDYGGRGDAWGRGFLVNPVFAGLCGEQAVCDYLNRRCGLSLTVDTSLRLTGDGGRDLDVVGISTQIKTRVIGKSNLIRRVSGSKRLMPLACDAFIFARLDLPVVHLLGWIWSAEASRVGVHERSRRADHFNLRIGDADLQPMSRFLEAIEDRRTA